jgi:hypothetical protein
LKLTAFEKYALILSAVAASLSLLVFETGDRRTLSIFFATLLIVFVASVELYWYMKYFSKRRHSWFAEVFLYTLGVGSGVLNITLDDELLYRLKGDAQNAFIIMRSGNHRVGFYNKNESIEKDLDIRSGIAITMNVEISPPSLTADYPRRDIDWSEIRPSKASMAALYLVVNIFVATGVVNILLHGLL